MARSEAALLPLSVKLDSHAVLPGLSLATSFAFRFNCLTLMACLGFRV